MSLRGIYSIVDIVFYLSKELFGYKFKVIDIKNLDQLINNSIRNFLLKKYGQKFSDLMVDVLHGDKPFPINVSKKLKDKIKAKRWDRTLGFQTRNPMHNCHYSLSKYALSQICIKDNQRKGLVLQPVVGVSPYRELMCRKIYFYDQQPFEGVFCL